jgi:hypothetical protein
MLAAFVRSVHKDLQWTNIAIGLACAIGAAAVVFPEPMIPATLAAGIGLIVAPFAFALAAFSMRELRFPGLRFERA